MTPTAHQAALIKAEKSYRDHIEGRAMEHACKTYLQALLDDADTIEDIKAEMSLVPKYKRTHQAEKIINAIKRRGGLDAIKAVAGVKV